MNEGFEAVAIAIDRARELLLAHGDKYTAPRLSTLARRLRTGDRSAIIDTLSEATGGMGSLNDRELCRENGDKIEGHEYIAVNKLLVDLVKDVENTVRATAASNHIRLLR